MKKWLRRNATLNLMTLAPCLRTPYSINEFEGTSYLVIPRMTALERLVIRWFNQPKAHWLKLDNLGRFVLTYCDGTHTVSEIEELLMTHYGEEAEPTLPRLVKFLQILDAHHIISMNVQKTSRSS
ncbi:hypothetical protein JOD43_000858 [Pullulanibacillus pueri]|uniref:PqqD family protein n=1 Tax=Pullulanibacillus pueri TaxID=1437324 RepID=A0A8J2ZYX4_9BACL|nr:PqqD family protein [Pullulanibacillus pueri]MBM7680694.1 hypothetical protein [Pullulanibacillus pueri]GGH87526.1 hypothetical protein GCM10007096_37740 [Pullulanibacillus pueri]